MWIRDAVQGDIDFPEPLLEMLNQPVVQRLRRIQQLGLASLVYPGATHSRFAHSLGVLGLVIRVLDRLKRKGRTLPAEHAMATYVFALVHDVGHLPFGHTLEDEWALFPRHDGLDRFRLVCSWAPDLAKAMDHLGALEPVQEALAKPDDSPWWLRLVAGPLDLDLLDYVRRDAYYCGLRVDYDDRVMDALDVVDDRLVLVLGRHGLERPDLVSEVIQTLRSRYFLTERVYLHHAKVAAGALLAKAVIQARAQGLQVLDLLQDDDWSLVQHLRAWPDPGVRRKAQALLDRALPKRALVLDGSLPESERKAIQSHCQGARLADLENTLAARVGIDSAEVMVYCAPVPHCKEMDMPTLTANGVVPFSQAVPRSAELLGLRQAYARLWRLYVWGPEPTVARLQEAARQEFGLRLADAGHRLGP